MDCFGYYQKLQNDKLCFIYNGEFNDEITDKVMALTEQNVNQFDELTKLRKKVSFLIVECFQNVVRHGESVPLPSNDPKGCFSARYDGTTNHISAVNLIHPHRVPELEALLKQINNLSKEKLKELYLKVLSEPEFTGRGAGLGLIEMARKSGQPLTYEFEETDNEMANFYLSIKLKNLQPVTTHNAPLAISKPFYDQLNADNVSMIYKGEYSQQAVYPITYIAKAKVEAEYNIGRQKRLFNLLIELIQNINVFSSTDITSEGILIISDTPTGPRITVGNPVSEDVKERLASQFNEINAMSLEQLEEVYGTELTNDGSNSKISLLSVARRSSLPLKFAFDAMDDGRFFYSLDVTI
jgi:hypothetical protein